ncbi:hypothetical protein TrLO_g13535 [Triparma laevis f. longispina]|uniref:Kinesin light chain n=1 Tax=Triparma laevis f. longispina TaxID=1714387 RepID=A0A9W7FS26_9STRA|nr:hypothetical protein TrLO_g13535 [Triparma laevis f. longispina]
MSSEVRGPSFTSSSNKVVPVLPSLSPRNSEKTDPLPKEDDKPLPDGGSWISSIRKLNELANEEGFSDHFKYQFDNNEDAYKRWKSVFDHLYLFGTVDLIAVVTRSILSSVDLRKLRALESLCDPNFFDDSGLLVAVRRRILEVLQQNRLRQHLYNAAMPPDVEVHIPQQLVEFTDHDETDEGKHQIDMTEKMEPEMLQQGVGTVDVEAEVVDEEILDACAALGVACSKDSQFEHARVYYNLAKDGYDNKLGPNNPKALKVEYGLICCSCESKYVMAEKLEGLVHKLEEVLGPNHEVTLDALNSYGACLDRNGKYESSRQILEKCLSRQEQILGPNHVKTLRTVNNLGLAYKHLSKNEHALELYKRDLKGCERVLGKNHPSTLMTVENIANLKMDGLKEFKEAEKYYARAMRGYKSQLGKYHECTMKCAKNFKKCLKASGNQARMDELKVEYPS